MRSAFKPIPTKIPGVNFTEILPELAKVNDKFTMIRSMSYTPNGLFNHTAAIYQIMTGYTTDKVSPSGQLEPPDPKDFPELRLANRPPAPGHRADAAVRHAAASAAGIQRRRQRRHRRVPRQGLRSVHALPEGDDMDMAKMDRIQIDDLKLPPEVFALRLQRRARLREPSRKPCRTSKRPWRTTISMNTTSARWT